MRASSIKQVQRLIYDLNAARECLGAFRVESAETFPVTASQGPYLGGHTVQLLPVPRSVVLSACERQVSKIVAELQALGVEVDGEGESKPDIFPSDIFPYRPNISNVFRTRDLGSAD